MISEFSAVGIIAATAATFRPVRSRSDRLRLVGNSQRDLPRLTSFSASVLFEGASKVTLRCRLAKSPFCWARYRAM